MRIVWDEPKRVATLKARGLDFAELSPEFFARATIVRAKKGRLMAIGAFSEVTVVVIFVPLGQEGLSVVSMRRANQKERMMQWPTTRSS